MPEIQNPNLQPQGSGGSGGDMRSTMAFVLMAMAVIFGYQFFFMKPKTNERPPAQTQSQAAAPANSAAEPGQPQSAASSAPAPAAAVLATPQIAARTETTTTVENPFFKIVFTNRGAQVKHWILKQYKDSTGKPLDMVQPEASARFGLPLALYTYEPALTAQLNGALYQVSFGQAQPSASGTLQAPTSITFHYAANGIDAVKTLRFDSSYVIGVEVQVKRNGQPVRALVEWPAGLGDMEEFHQTGLMSSRARTMSFFAWSIGNRPGSLAGNKVSGNETLDEPYQYAAVMDQYFAAAFLPDSPDRATAVTLHNAIDLPGNPGDPNSKKKPADVLGLAVGDVSGTTRLRLFAGPKATDLLKSIHATGPDGKPDGPPLYPLIQFGFWAFIAKPIYYVLRFLVAHGVPNWGWAIVITTVILNLGLLPTRVAAMKSSLKMMRIQPKVDALKKRYSHLKMNDPKRAEMNTEMMALYKMEGVNMYGSCLPMMVPLIFLWPYDSVLLTAVELRQSHWLWLPDLSLPDPTHILPMLMIVTMFLTQFITPSPGMDPTQRRMMAFMMPVMFGFMFWSYASGLTLYWGTGYVIMLAMQIGINRSHWGREMHAIAARRAAKKTGLFAGRK